MNSMGQRLKARIRDAALAAAAVLCVAIGVVLEEPMTEAFRVAVTPAQADRAVLGGAASVIDGDTLEIGSQRIRLHGIDSPESGQSCADAGGQDYRCGQRAALALSDRIGRAPLICDQSDTDRHGRAIAICFRDGVDLNAWMVREGHAVAWRKYSTDYLGEEALARAEGRGIWAGTFAMPWDWRVARRASDAASGAQTPPPPGCEIKGNINSASVRIYHVPGQQHYERTRINTARGERWFCSEGAARQAGWRRAKR